jgi:hypothetical protein
MDIHNDAAPQDQYGSKERSQEHPPHLSRDRLDAWKFCFVTKLNYRITIGTRIFPVIKGKPCLSLSKIPIRLILHQNNQGV